MKLLILDRDGVINHESRDYIKNPDEWQPIAGSLEAISDFTKAGYTIVVATNQSGVGRKLFSLDSLQQIHAKMLAAVESKGGKIFQIYFCPHLPTDNCNCRKPKPGMFEQIAHDLNYNLRDQAIFVGDSLRDAVLGLNAGCKFFLVTGIGSDGKETIQQLTEAQKQQINIVENLAEVARILLA